MVDLSGWFLNQIMDHLDSTKPYHGIFEFFGPI